MESKEQPTGQEELRQIDSIPPNRHPISNATRIAILLILAACAKGAPPEVADASPPYCHHVTVAAGAYKPLMHRGDGEVTLYQCGEDSGECGCVQALIKRGVTPEILGRYPDSFDADIIFSLSILGVSPEMAREYLTANPSWNQFDIKDLAEAKISPESVKGYSRRFVAGSGRIIASLVKNRITPELTNEYFTVADMMLRYHPHSDIVVNFVVLAERRIPHEKARRYAVRFHGLDIDHLLEAGIDPELVFDYPRKLSGYTISLLVKMGVDAKRAAQYPDFFKNFGISELAEQGITPEMVRRYPPYGPSRIIEFIKGGITPKQAAAIYREESQPLQ